jgi:uncharacterized protein involved in outer membrane biogenesis
MDSATSSSSRRQVSPARGQVAQADRSSGASSFWRWTRNGATAIAVLVALYALLGFLVLPTLLKPRLETGLSERTGRHATLGRIEFNPFTLHARLSDFNLSDRDPRQPFVRFATLDLDIAPASVRYRAPVLDAIRLERPQIALTRNEDGTSSVDDLAHAKPAAGTGTETGAPMSFSLNNIEIDDGSVTLDDRVHGRRLVASALGIGIPFVSNLRHDATIRVTPHLQGALDGTRFALKANGSSPFLDRREATLDLDFDALPLARYAEYVALPGGVLVADGALTTRLKLRFVTEKTIAQSVVLTGMARLDKLALVRKDGSRLAGARSIDVAVGKLDWLARTVAIDAISIDGPDMDVRRSESGAFELAAMAPATASPPGKPWQFALAQLGVSGGTLRVADRSVTPAYATTLSGIAIAARAIASSGTPGRIELTFVADDGAHAAVQADVDVAHRALRGHADVTKLDVSRLEPYYASALNADIRRATLDVKADFASSIAPFALTVSNGSASLARVEAALHDDRDPFLRIDALAVSGFALDAENRSVAIDDVRWGGGALRVLRQGDGTLALERIVRAQSEGGAVSAQASTAAGSGWSIVARKAAIEHLVVDVEDRVPKPAVKLLLSDVRLTADNVGNAPKGTVPFDVAARIGRSGRARVQGTLDKAPLRADVRITASGIDVVPIKSYFESRTNVIVTRGNVAANGRLVYAATTQGAPRLSYKGDASIADFASLDRPTSQDLLRVASLKLTGVDAASDPVRVVIAGVAMDRFFARAILDSDAKLNLKELAAPGAASEDSVQPAPTTSGGVTTKALPAPAAAGALPVSIGRIEVSNGEVQYSDYFVQPNYNAHLTNVAGSVGAMSATQSGDVDITGSVEGTAPVALRGSVNPFAAQLQLDLTGKASDVDLPPLTPYSVKYAGYGIEKGKLSLEVHYRIDDRKLAATNRLRLDQLTFGQHVDSPTATKLPVLLAVSLLKDRNGVIDLDLPIQGTLDDPKFSVWRVVVQIFVNLITKAVTAPFALLASIGGGGEQLAFVEFAPGHADLSPAAVAKLGTLAKALNDRPALKLDASGRAIPDVDREGLKRAALDAVLRIQKQKAIAAAGESAPPLESLAIDPSEYPKLLESVYRDTKLADKPRNVFGMAKAIPAPEMEAMLLASYRVDDEALATLANRRAQAIKEWFAHDGHVAAERIFIVKPKLDNDGIKDAGAPTRVDFAIR